MSEQKLVVRPLAERNAIAAEQGLRELSSRISELNNIIMTQQQGMTALTARITSLEEQLRQVQAQSMGHGPTG